MIVSLQFGSVRSYSGRRRWWGKGRGAGCNAISSLVSGLVPVGGGRGRVRRDRAGRHGVVVLIVFIADPLVPEKLRQAFDTWFVSALISSLETHRGRDGSHESATGCCARQARGESDSLGRAKVSRSAVARPAIFGRISEQVSREHAEFTISGDAVVVRDLGSRNGTLVNGKALTRACQLKDRDLVQVGPLTFAVSILDAPAAAVAAKAKPAATAAPEPKASPDDVSARRHRFVVDRSQCRQRLPINPRPSTAATRSRSRPSRTPAASPKPPATAPAPPPASAVRRRIRAPARGRAKRR